MLAVTRRAIVAALLVGSLAACGSSTASSAPAQSNATSNAPATSAAASTAASQAAPASIAPAASTSSGGGADVTAACSDLTSLRDMDYAFGKSFSMIQSLAPSSMARTLDDVSAFAGAAPTDLRPAMNDLVIFWTAMTQNPQAVTESDVHWTNANTTLQAWMTANCG